jgi:hypothetical protein
MRKEWLLCGSHKGIPADGQQVGSQRGREVWVMVVGGEELAIAGPLVVGPATMDLKVGVRVLAVQSSSLCTLLHGLNWRALGFILLPLLLLLLLLLDLEGMGLGFRRIEISLAFLEMFDLARRVLRSHEAAVKTSYFITLRVPLAEPAPDYCRILGSRKSA